MPISEGENLEVDPPRRLVQSFRALWSDEVKGEGTSRVTWEIEPVGDSCRLTVTHDQLREGANDQLYGGWPHDTIAVCILDCEVSGDIHGVGEIEQSCRSTVVLHEGQPLDGGFAVRHACRELMVSPAKLANDPGLDRSPHLWLDAQPVAASLERGFWLPRGGPLASKHPTPGAKHTRGSRPTTTA
jgi:hypothetical protein